MGEDLSLERHYHSVGGGDAREVPERDVLPPDYVDLRPSRAKRLPPELAARVLVPLCTFDLAAHFQDYLDCADRRTAERGVSSLAWSGLQQAGFKLFTCFIRGPEKKVELVVVLPEGVVSWPLSQLTPDAAAFLEVQAL